MSDFTKFFFWKSYREESGFQSEGQRVRSTGNFFFLISLRRVPTSNNKKDNNSSWLNNVTVENKFPLMLVTHASFEMVLIQSTRQSQI